MTVERIPLRQARAQLSGLLTKVEAGTKVIITRDGKDAVLLSPAPTKPDESTARPLTVPASREAAQRRQGVIDGILAGNNRSTRKK